MIKCIVNTKCGTIYEKDLPFLALPRIGEIIVYYTMDGKEKKLRVNLVEHYSDPKLVVLPYQCGITLQCEIVE